MSQVAVDFQSQASSTVLPKAGRQNHAAQKSSSSQFDDLLTAIPDAPPEPRARAAADERPQPAQSRATKSDDRPERASRDDRPAGADRKARSDNKPDNNTNDSRVPAADNAPPKDAGATTTDTAATETKPAAADETVAADDAGTKTTDSQNTDTASATQDVVAALVPQAVAIDPATSATTEPAAAGDAATQTGAAKVETPTAAIHPSIKAAEQQAVALANQSSDLNADDAEVLSALATKAQQGLKDGQGDKAEKKASTDKPADAAKLDGEAGQTGQSGLTGQPTQAEGGDAKTADAKPVQSDLAKVAVEHQRGKADTDAKPADHAAQAINVNSVVAKTDGMQLQNFSAMLHTTHAAGASAAASGPAPLSNDDKAVSIANVAVEVSAKISSGKNQFDIRLDPEELGRIHVKVNVDRDGNITTHMVADRPDTLDLLRRDTQGLERALQDAGLKTSDNSLQFSLRDQTQQQQQNQQDGQASRRPVADDDLTTTLTTTVIARDYGRYTQRPSGVDIRV